MVAAASTPAVFDRWIPSCSFSTNPHRAIGQIIFFSVRQLVFVGDLLQVLLDQMLADIGSKLQDLIGIFSRQLRLAILLIIDSCCPQQNCKGKIRPLWVLMPLVA